MSVTDASDLTVPEEAAVQAFVAVLRQLNRANAWCLEVRRQRDGSLLFCRVGREQLSTRVKIAPPDLC